MSVVTIVGAQDDPFLASAGVSNKIWLHRMLATSANGRLLYTHSSEIRGLASVDTPVGELLIFAAVDGAVGIVEMTTGRLAGISEELTEVLNSVAGALREDELIIVGGTNTGRIVRFNCPVAELAVSGSMRELERSPAQLRIAGDLTEHNSAVNCVRVIKHRNRVAVISTSSDHTWRWTWLDTQEATSLMGHIGPVWSAVAAVDRDRLYVVTAGGEGACRAWLADVVLHEKMLLGQLSRHRGGVTAIALAMSDHQKISVVTGDGEGEVRSWQVGDINTGGACRACRSDLGACMQLPSLRHRTPPSSIRLPGRAPAADSGAGEQTAIISYPRHSARGRNSPHHAEFPRPTRSHLRWAGRDANGLGPGKQAPHGHRYRVPVWGSAEPVRDRRTFRPGVRRRRSGWIAVSA